MAASSTNQRLELYREVHGEPTARPSLLLLHGGGSTIDTNFGALIPHLSQTRQVVAMELQGHGHTGSIDRPASFENSAEDVAATLAQMELAAVDVLGFSNGGNVAMRLAMRHPHRVRRQIVSSAFFRREGMIEGFWDGLAHATVAEMPQPYRDADQRINPDQTHLPALFALDQAQMLGFVDWAEDELAAMRVPTLVVAGDRDVVRTSHTAAMAALIPDARLLIVPAGHGDYLGELVASAGDLTCMRATLPLLLGFLDDTQEGP